MGRAIKNVANHWCRRFFRAFDVNVCCNPTPKLLLAIQYRARHTPRFLFAQSCLNSHTSHSKAFSILLGFRVIVEGFMELRLRCFIQLNAIEIHFSKPGVFFCVTRASAASSNQNQQQPKFVLRSCLFKILCEITNSLQKMMCWSMSGNHSETWTMKKHQKVGFAIKCNLVNASVKPVNIELIFLKFNCYCPFHLLTMSLGGVSGQPFWFIS